MTDIKALETRLNEYKELENRVFKMNRELVEELYQLEKETFGGLKYMEFIDQQKKEIRVNDNINVQVQTYNIYGEYKINDDVILRVSLTTYADDSRVAVRIVYKNKETTDLPRKYKKEYDELVAECFKYKIENPSKKYQEKYRINMY
jgi:hypothetical protein